MLKLILTCFLFLLILFFLPLPGGIVAGGSGDVHSGIIAKANTTVILVKGNTMKTNTMNSSLNIRDVISTPTQSREDKNISDETVCRKSGNNSHILVGVSNIGYGNPFS